jgi:hypothetical protein
MIEPRARVEENIAADGLALSADQIERLNKLTPAAGIPLLRLAAQTALLEAEALAEMGGSEGRAARIALAVNADSMATWFTGGFGVFGDVLFDIRIRIRIIRRGCCVRAR